MCHSSATDSELMLQFTQHTQEEAFAELVQRHSGVVFGVCSSVLRHAQDAEDAYQETFLTLARRAESVRRHASVAGWLYRVAQRVALRIARQRNSTEELRELETSAECPLEAVARRELTLLVAEEIDRLPAKYRDVIVLCHLQGLSRQRAAEQLECTEDSVKSRLVRARRDLRIRLARRGVAMSFAIGFLALACQESVRAELTALVVREASSPPPPVDSISTLEGMANMKLTLVASASLLCAMFLFAILPIQSDGGGPNENATSLSSLDNGQPVPSTDFIVAGPAPQQGVANDERRMTFEKQKAGSIPQFWRQVTGSGRWQVTNDYSSSGVTGIMYSRDDQGSKRPSVFVLDPEHVRYADVDLSVRVRLGDSLSDSGGGVVWHYQDTNNFYSATLSGNGYVEVFRTRHGKRQRLVAARSALKPELGWPRVRVVHQGDEITLFVNDRRVVAAREPSIFKIGKVGLVSSARHLGLDDFQVKTATSPDEAARTTE